MNANTHDFADYHSASAHKLLSDNRELFIQQSRATVACRAAPFPSSPPDPTPSPSAADCLSSSSEGPSE